MNIRRAKVRQRTAAAAADGDSQRRRRQWVVAASADEGGVNRGSEAAAERRPRLRTFPAVGLACLISVDLSIQSNNQTAKRISGKPQI